MIEARREPSFIQEHAAELGLDGELRFQELQYDELVETARPSRHGEIDVGRSTLAEFREHAVLAIGAVFFGGKARHRVVHASLRYRADGGGRKSSPPRCRCCKEGWRVLCHQKGKVAKKVAPACDGATSNETRSEVAGTEGRVSQSTVPVARATKPTPRDTSARRRVRFTPSTDESVQFGIQSRSRRLRCDEPTKPKVANPIVPASATPPKT